MNRFARGALIALGCVLLLPGACSLVYLPLGISSLPALFAPPAHREDYSSLAAQIWLTGVAFGVAGASLIVWVIKRGR